MIPTVKDRAAMLMYPDPTMWVVWFSWDDRTWLNDIVNRCGDVFTRQENERVDSIGSDTFGKERWEYYMRKGVLK